MSETICLKRNDFKDNFLAAFVSLREDDDFADVTLACDDGAQVKAHKVILAASSPFFENMLKRNKHGHLVILMRGMNSTDLLAIVDFLYLGEAKICRENLESFFAIADELKLNGLTGPKSDDALMQKEAGFKNASPKRENPIYKHDKYFTRSAEHSQASVDEFYSNSEVAPIADPDISTRSNIDEEIMAFGHDAKTVALKSNFHGDLQELDEKVISIMEKTEKKNVHGQPIYQCTLCGKKGKNGQLKEHIEANHLEGVSIPCHLCQIMFRSKKALKTHICYKEYFG